jgi:hypothetical protein
VGPAAAAARDSSSLLPASALLLLLLLVWQALALALSDVSRSRTATSAAYGPDGTIDSSDDPHWDSRWPILARVVAAGTSTAYEDTVHAYGILVPLELAVSAGSSTADQDPSAGRSCIRPYPLSLGNFLPVAG